MPAILKYLLEKNWIVLKRNWKWILAEQLLVIVLYFLFLFQPIQRTKDYIVKLLENKNGFYQTQASLCDLSLFKQLWSEKDQSFQFGLLYTPVTNFTTTVMQSLQENFDFNNIHGYNSEETMINYFKESDTFAGIVFHNVEIGVIPKQLSFTLRFPSEFRTIDNNEDEQRFWITRLYGMLTSRDTSNFQCTDLYLREGFLQVQHQIFVKWLELAFPFADIGEAAINISVKSIEYFQDNNWRTRRATPYKRFLYYFTFLFTFLHIVHIFARERNENIVAHHWIYGFEPNHHRFANFVIQFPRLLLLNVWVAFMLSIFHPQSLIHFGYMLLFLSLYSILLIAYAMIIVTLFLDAKNTLLFAAIIWLGNYGLFTLLLDYDEQTNKAIYIIFLLCFNNILPYGLQAIQQFDNYADLIRIRNLFYVEISLIVLLLFVLSILEYHWPGRYIKRLPYSFLGITIYYFRDRKRINKTLTPTVKSINTESQNCYQYGPIFGKEILFIRKVFSYTVQENIRQQLINISMKIFLNEITVILGHYGTGKTSLISFLAGWCKPHMGTIYFDGDNDIYTNWNLYRYHVDVSMPNNALFDFLTVSETLLYFCKVKMVYSGKNTAFNEIKKWLDVLSPVIKDRTLLVRELNFSQKRLLSLCCTLLGNRKIILLDEPTAHMTFDEQCLYWQILRKAKSPKRAIILTTFSADEADAIGDRIALLDNGHLIAYGTSPFLRTQFGTGFDLIILKDPSKPTKPITNFLTQRISSIQLIKLSTEHLVYKLPKNIRHLFQHLLLDLERESENFGISKISVRGSGLNDVLMTLSRQSSTKNTLNPNFHWNFTQKEPERECSYFEQMQAMFYKKAIFQAPNYIPLFMFFVLFFLINLINLLTENYATLLEPISTSIFLGYPTANESRTLLAELDKCNFVEIYKLKDVEHLNQINSTAKHIYIEELICRYQERSEEGRNRAISLDTVPSYGAVERAATGKNMTIWLNQRVFHTAPIVLNLAHNMILQNHFPDDMEIFTYITNKPIDIPLHRHITFGKNQISHLRVPLSISIVTPITVACFIRNIIEERSTYLFTLQRLAGIRLDIFWIAHFLWDFGTLFAYNIVFVVILGMSTIVGFEASAKLLTFLLINVYGLAELTFIYLVSSLFITDTEWTAFFKTILIQFLAGIASFIFYWDTLFDNKYVYTLLRISPTFSLLDGINLVYTITNEEKYCEKRCMSIKGCTMHNICNYVFNCCTDQKEFRWTVLGLLPSLLYMTLSTAVFVLIFFCLQIVRQEKKYSPNPRVKQMNTICYPQDDEDVVKEKLYIAAMSTWDCNQYNIVVDQLEYEIPKKDEIPSLRTVSFALKDSTSMAIYGSRHCGKTRLIHKLVGDDGYQFGEMYICKENCRYGRTQATKCLGFCPQNIRCFNCIFTPSQLFTLLFMIRGLSKLQVKDRLHEITFDLDLYNSMNVKICNLNNFVKQKVYIGIALIVNNKVLILDEPTRGMSAEETEIIWDVLRYARNCGVTIVFSTSESSVCEELADYMIVVDKGEMLAIGSMQYVKNKYTSGFYLDIKLIAGGDTEEQVRYNLLLDVNNMERYAHFLHKDSVLITQHDYYLRFYIPSSNIKYSYLFGSLEKSRKRLSISDYTLWEPTFFEALTQINNKYRSRRKYSAEEIKNFQVRRINEFPSVFKTIRAKQFYPTIDFQEEYNEENNVERKSANQAGTSGTRTANQPSNNQN